MSFGLTLALCLAGAEPIYFVDLTRVILETDEGKKLKKQIEDERVRAEDEVKKREEEIGRLRKALERDGDAKARAEYDRLVSALAEFTRAREAELEKMQDDALFPIADGLERMITAPERGPALVLDVDEHPPLFPKARCDVSDWLVRAHKNKKVDALPKREECVARVVLYVAIDPIIGALPEASRSKADLDAFQKERQAQLDTRQRELSRAHGVEAEKGRLALADRYAAYQEELADREARAAAKLRRAAIEKVQNTAPQGALLLEKIADVAPIAGACDATRFFSEPDRAIDAVCPSVKP